ncbi:RNA-guided endonuclease InsQ/TnpB family protein [Marinomonas algarum]|uniref:Transposase n=1 Tax=Marinomonas algarum TaxID=2883105 RepID=A0A9X1RU61_9GAMM|nr:transposase [Marinomonas algarum]MCB5162966.1 transposase [Marinomonas algarum]
MLVGIKLRAHPTPSQKQVLSQWMGCARSIWNAKVDEEKYYRTFARRFCVVGTYAPIDTKTAQFKSKELSPWLYQCPSQIIRNSAVNWYQTYQKFMKGACGRPKRKPKTNNIGYLSFKAHSQFEIPKSLYVRKERGQYYVSFCYENGQDEAELSSHSEHLAFLQGSTKAYLEEHTIGVDRGVAIPVHAGSMTFDFCVNQKKNMTKADRYIKRLQRKMARQKLTSNRRKKTKYRIAHHHAKKANIRNDFAHKTSRSLVDSKAKVIVFEALKTSSMTRKPKAKQDEQGRYTSNKAKQKAGLNKSILNVGWHIIETYTKYKAYQAGKAVFKVNPAYTSQECAKCGHTHPDNRPSQELFVCGCCGNTDNADNNASLVIKKRAVNLILDTGTVLSGEGVLRTKPDSVRGGNRKTIRVRSSNSGVQRSVKKEELAA